MSSRITLLVKEFINRVAYGYGNLRGETVVYFTILKVGIDRELLIIWKASWQAHFVIPKNIDNIQETVFKWTLTNGEWSFCNKINFYHLFFVY